MQIHTPAETLLTVFQSVDMMITEGFWQNQAPKEKFRFCFDGTAQVRTQSRTYSFELGFFPSRVALGLLSRLLAHGAEIDASTNICLFLDDCSTD